MAVHPLDLWRREVAYEMNRRYAGPDNGVLANVGSAMGSRAEGKFGYHFFLLFTALESRDRVLRLVTR
jgi:hypothetical protein